MAQVNFRVDDDIKAMAERACEAMGMSMSTALNIFLVKVAKEKRIPFEITAEPFYSESNIKYLNKKMEEYKRGELVYVKHDLIED